MSIDRSLKVRSGALKERNVWTRAERLEVLERQQKWQEGEGVLGLPKVRTRFKQASRKKKKKKDAEE